MRRVEGTGPDDGDAADAALRSLLASAGGAARARERRHRERITAAATFAGALAAGASSGGTVEIATQGGHRFHGVVDDVGAHVVTMRTAPTRRTLVVIGAIVSLRAVDDGALDGGEAGTDPTSLADHLVEASAERLDVALHGADGSTIFGRLDGVGEDVARARTPTGGVVYVRLDSLEAVSLTGSG